MTISLKSDASGNSGSIQVAGVDRLILNTDGSLVAGANPATGTRSMALATMQKFADEFGASLAGSGYQKLPSGLIIQWGGTGVIPGPSGVTVTFPVAFPNVCFAVFATAAGLPSSPLGVYSITKTSVGIDFYSAADVANAFWFAIGY